MAYLLHERDDILYFKVTSNCFHQDVEEFKNNLSLVLDKAIELNKQVVLDFSESGYICSAGLNAIIGFIKKTKEKDIPIFLGDVSEKLTTLFDIINMWTLIDKYIPNM